MAKEKTVYSETTLRVGGAITLMLAQIAELFKPGAKLTFLARIPGNPEADILITSDDFDELAAAIERSRNREEIDLS